MCIPAAVAMMAVQATSSIAQGIAASQAASANAKIAKYQGDAALAAANVEAGQIRYRGDMVLGQTRAQQAANNVDLSGGSPADVGAESARNIEFDALNAYYGGQSKKWAADIEASQFKAQSRAALTNALFSAGGTILSTAIDQNWFAPRNDRATSNPSPVR
ncbi:MAG: hypothetical protein GC190_21040 [Alphaproteobacteria bacterium]|nr:hypothetical protein [Alphaproteobacteria bacterium]